jgi:NAD(P)-dependent dehydrogenase (short-subunit alcohol dehydrogenase family)
MRNVEGKTAFITGAASGIGLGMARAFVSAGMNVVVADVRQTALDEAGQVLRYGGKRVHLMRLDVTDRVAMANAANEVVRVFDNVHVLCNNAGLNGTTPLDEISHEEWDWLVNVNLNGVMNGIIAFLPKMKAHRQGGHIVNTSSMAGILPLPSPGGSYSAVKFGVRGLTDSLRLALAYHGIGVSVLCPGLVQTNIRTSANALMPEVVRIRTSAPPESPMDGEFTPRNAGMDPLEVGNRVLAGIRANAPYILTHGEFVEEVGEVFDAILAAFPSEAADDPGRLYYENRRREATRKANAAARAIE